MSDLENAQQVLGEIDEALRGLYKASEHLGTALLFVRNEEFEADDSLGNVKAIVEVLRGQVEAQRVVWDSIETNRMD